MKQLSKNMVYIYNRYSCEIMSLVSTSPVIANVNSADKINEENIWLWKSILEY